MSCFFLCNSWCNEDDERYRGDWGWVYEMNYLSRGIVSISKHCVYEDYFDVKGNEWGVRFDESIPLKIKRVL